MNLFTGDPDAAGALWLREQDLLREDDHRGELLPVPGGQAGPYQ